MLEKEVRKKTQAFSLMAIVLAASLGALIYFGYVPSASLRNFSSYQDLNSFVTKNTPSWYYSSFEGPMDRQFSNSLNPQSSNGFGFQPTPMPTAPMSVPASASEGLTFFVAPLGPSYSTTNVQVAGVDEADIVKTDGYNIYLLSNSKNAVYILNADPQNAAVVSKISFTHDTSLAGIYLSQDSSKLAVLGSKYTLRTETSTYWTSDLGQQTYTREYYQPQETRTFIKIYEISNKTNPVLVRDFAMSGSYFNSRMIGEYVYAVISQPVRVENQTVALPALYAGAETYCTPPSSIYYVDREDSSYNYYTFTSVVGLSMLNDAQTVTNLTIMLGGASNLYVSASNIYLTYPGASTYSVWMGANEPTTEVQRISISGNNLAFVAKATVPGTVLNQYSMDEYNGNFRIATTSRREGILQNNVYVLDLSMRQVGRLENLAPGETIHSARFMGDKCYLVTFKKTDPLFVIDLAQPNLPKVLGELKIPGYSDYLHPYDETHIIGVGKETEEAAYGDFAWYQGLKLSLFDVSNVSTPQQMAKIVVGDRGTDSFALSDPKAFLFDRAKNLLVIPVNLAVVNRTLTEPGPSAYGKFVWQGAYVFNVTLDGGFELKGIVTHVENPSSRDSADPWTNSSYWITRALYIDNTLYTISDEMVKLDSLDNLQPIAQISLK